MIRVVGPEDAMMRQGVGTIGVGEASDRPVHDIAMQRPFEKGGNNDTGDKTDGRPIQEFVKQGDFWVMGCDRAKPDWKRSSRFYSKILLSSCLFVA